MFRKILNNDQVRQADAYSMEHEPITSLDLMERAANAFVQAIIPSIMDKSIVVLCGIGNNGGDGLAVTRILRTMGYHADAILIKFSTKLSEDCQANFDRLTDTKICEEELISDLESYDIIIDALLGSGINRTVDGYLGQIIDQVNTSNKPVIAIDCPSGLFANQLTPGENIIRADLVISFQRPKLAFFLPENQPYISDWKVVDIGLDEQFIQSQNSSKFVLDERVSNLLRERNRFSHKGTYGHAAIFAGSTTSYGAAILAARGCLRSGVGLLTVFTPQKGYSILQQAVPEAMCIPDQEIHFLTEVKDLSKFNVIGIGPGIGQNHKTAQFLLHLIQQVKTPLVLDADAINILSQHKEWCKHLPPNTILTPHIGEFDRLTGKSHSSLERFEKQRDFCKKYKCIVLLKDANTSVMFPSGEQYFNTSGNAGMATGGSGDVLTGMITGLLAQGYIPQEAALIGVWHHGHAGDLAANTKGKSALISSDIVEHIRIEHS